MKLIRTEDAVGQAGQIVLKVGNSRVDLGAVVGGHLGQPFAADLAAVDGWAFSGDGERAG